jgi:hypothetical protein
MTDQGAADETYREFIDRLVDAAPSLAARLVREESIASKAPAAAAANELVSRLSLADRTTLATMLDAERSGAIHDVLASLTWWLHTGRVRWSAGGVPMPAGREGGLHCDYIGRLDGWEWPDRVAVRTPRT